MVKPRGLCYNNSWLKVKELVESGPSRENIMGRRQGGGTEVCMKTVLITGGNKGIGFACAKEFAKNGYHVILAGRDEGKLRDAQNRLNYENCVHVLWDVADISTAALAIQRADSLFGDIDVFVNNAGIVTQEDIDGVDFLEKTESAWDQTMNINLKGLFFSLQAEAKYMIGKGIRGHIVNLCSEMGFRAADNAYCISKWGVRGLTMGLARRLARDGIILNGIAPGETATEILRQKEGERVPINSPRGERAMPSEIAEAIFFLANSQNIIGEILVSDGGRRLH